MDNQIDQATLDLIIQLQLQDTQTLIKGKHRAGEQSDAELAAGLYRLELESLASFQYDHTMSRSIAHAVLTDGELVAEHVFEEEQATHDREFAIHGEYPEQISRTTTPGTVMNEEMIKKLTALYVGNAEPPNGEPSSSHASPAVTSATVSEQRQCVSCMTDVPFFETVQCPCSHEYCRGCIADLFKAAMYDESLFPPRCCRQAIPLGLNQIFLPAKLVGQYRAKELEYATKDRTYCHLPNCSTFIPPAFIKGDIAICQKCQSETCTICKSQSHEDNCPQDTATLDLLRIASENDWQRCYSCRRMVDLITGCNHITCHCGAQFCYVCGVPWKDCRCDQWDEHRLLDRANVLVDRDARGMQIEQADRAVRVERERHNLVENHQCLHQRWRSRRGSFQCEECYHQLPQFIYECRNCRILACRRCRFNRL
ncbi:hypothetical protein TRIATDRAFT_82700 [Trichoderma atroviride IMI 206040]|uniref:RBR-type E3 ubiquitin transferase n=1 Tax=Hypocrea atroviridis (strain ATCC 20476 / IMI 206040) TaxID=452589 RepID=G9NKE3_HYPAI|nr:uncharacterized protein TRIATDRAFT_82700 [Trichoderma atroviride IMI 206040]EHK49360.1 hypothetical protein TRIATDRAFT_82700 [Trichoderma atroviride IMI 206040]